VRLQTQRQTLETVGHRHWRVHRNWNTDLAIVVFGSILVFAIVAALMLYISEIPPH
jgi:hypothetical protein